MERSLSTQLERSSGQASDHLSTIGRVIDERFEIQAEVGSGGMGTVYRALDRVTGTLVALKVARGRADLERFQSETAALSALDHRRIVRYVAHGTPASGEPYLAMEWLEGADLSARITKGTLTVEEALVVARGAAEALEVLHSRGIVHRDVKPGNLFLPGGELAEVKLLDFGIARSTREAIRLTTTGQALGTPAYMSPEQARGGEGIDARTDVFALGCVLFECLTGRPPFIGDHPIAVLAKLLIQDAPRLSELCPQAPSWLSELVARMLAKDREQRPRDGAAVLVELHRLRDRPSQQSSPGTGERAAVAALTNDEQRMLCVVLSRAAGETDATMLPSQRTVAEEQVRAAITSRGGRLEMLANGSMLAAVTGGESPDDLAARAARCALAMASVVTTPVALATGRGIVAGRLPAGVVVDQAVRLLGGGRARPGAVRIDVVTAGLLDTRFDVRPEGGELYLFGERDVTDTQRTLLGKPTRCVGREREIGTLGAMLRECVAEPIARAVLLTAPAGTGKTRLLHEFLGGARAIDPGALILVGRGDSVGAQSPFALAADVLQRAAGLLHGEPIEARRRKLRVRLGRHLAGDALAPIVEILGEVTSAPVSHGEASEALIAARADPVVMGDAIRMAWEDWLAAECDAGAVVLVIEDLHWGDLPSVSLIDAALRRLAERPFFVLATARPEVHAAFPDLWIHRGLQEIRVGPLTPRASERLVREALGPAADDDTVAFVARRAEGHPFFLEELIRAVAQGRGRDSLPDTVLGMLEGRLDALDPEVRRVLRAASVFGETFWRAGVASLVGGPTPVVARLLDDLVTKEIVVRRRASRVANEIEYGFVHALVRDAAYAMLTDADRALGHRLAGDWLESAGEPDPMVLAEHFDRGGDAARAMRWFERGALSALEGNDLPRAIERAERAMRCDAQGEALGALELLVAEASYHRGDLARADELAESAAGRLPTGTGVWFQAVATVLRAAGQLGNNDRVLAWVTRVADAIPQPGPSEIEARAAQVVCLCRAASQLLWAQRGPDAARIIEQITARAGDFARLPPNAEGWVHRVLAEKAFLLDGRLDAMAEELGGASDCFDRAGALRDACTLRAMRGATLGMLGEAEEGERAILRAIAEAERLGSPYLFHFGHAELPLVYLGAERYDDARKACLRALEGLGGSQRLACGIHIGLAIAALEQGDPEGAEREARAALAMKVAPPMRAIALGLQARSLNARSLHAEALPLAQEGATLSLSGGIVEMFSGTAELALAETLDALGRRAEARVALAEGERRAHAVADRLADPAVRARYLAQPHPNRQIFALVRAWDAAPPEPLPGAR